MDKLEKAQCNGIYYLTVVNYCNILSHISRLPKAMHTIRPIAAQGFGLAIGNLAMELYDFSKFDYDTDINKYF
ncbi:hypothetical protein GLW20_14160 [Virgibacillus halodenitrificans]|nr:hypothetical protein [Virgibacillus halodenitrificans]